MRKPRLRKTTRPPVTLVRAEAGTRALLSAPAHGALITHFIHPSAQPARWALYYTHLRDEDTEAREGKPLVQRYTARRGRAWDTPNVAVELCALHCHDAQGERWRLRWSLTFQLWGSRDLSRPSPCRALASSVRGRVGHPGGPFSDGPLPTDLWAYHHQVLGWQTGLWPSGTSRGWETQAGKGQGAHSGFGTSPCLLSPRASARNLESPEERPGCCCSQEGPQPANQTVHI